MRFLLDTHVIIWYFEDSPGLPRKIAEIIDDPENEIYISSVSLWEIAIKVNIGKLDLQVSLNELLHTITNSEFSVIQIEDDYLNGLEKLPAIHKDPFDRMIISSALSENLTIITVDNNIQQYKASWIW